MRFCCGEDLGGCADECQDEGGTELDDFCNCWLEVDSDFWLWGGEWINYQGKCHDGGFLSWMHDRREGGIVEVIGVSVDFWSKEKENGDIKHKVSSQMGYSTVLVGGQVISESVQKIQISPDT